MADTEYVRVKAMLNALNMGVSHKEAGREAGRAEAGSGGCFRALLEVESQSQQGAACECSGRAAYTIGWTRLQRSRKAVCRIAHD